MTCVFIAVWTPYCVESLWAMYQTEISVIAAVMPTMCCKSSPMLNPLVLIISSSDFREDFKKLCPWLCALRARLHGDVSTASSVGGNEPAREHNSSTYYIRQTDGVGKKDDAAAVYYNNERVFIGHIRTEQVEAETSILKKDVKERTQSQLSIDNEFQVSTSGQTQKKKNAKGKVRMMRTKAVSPIVPRKGPEKSPEKRRPSTS